jgi:hypothetical protein
MSKKNTKLREREREYSSPQHAWSNQRKSQHGSFVGMPDNYNLTVKEWSGQTARTRSRPDSLVYTLSERREGGAETWPDIEGSRKVHPNSNYSNSLQFV